MNQLFEFLPRMEFKKRIGTHYKKKLISVRHVTSEMFYGLDGEADAGLQKLKWRHQKPWILLKRKRYHRAPVKRIRQIGPRFMWRNISRNVKYAIQRKLR